MLLVWLRDPTTTSGLALTHVEVIPFIFGVRGAALDLEEHCLPFFRDLGLEKAQITSICLLHLVVLLLLLHIVVFWRRQRGPACEGGP